MDLKIALLRGDGIGPEVLAQSVKCLHAVEETFNHRFTFTEGVIGGVAMAQFGKPLPEVTADLCRNSDAILFGTIGTLKYDSNPSARIRPEQGLLQLRRELELFTNIRPVKVFPTLVSKSPLKKHVIFGTDFIIYRELTGGVYFGEKKLNKEGTVASDLCEYSEKEIDRIAHLAFKAAKNRRKKLTLVDKANVLETSRLWRKVVSKIGESYPEVQLDFLFVDNAAMQMMLNPNQFDVILTDNMFGDILSDQGSAICGSKGLLPSASIGYDHAMFEPFHGSYPQAEGKNVANPVASILSTAMMLSHFGMHEESKAVVVAVDKSMRKQVITKDLDPSSKYGTNEVGDFIAANIIDSDENLNYNYENIGLGRSTII